MPECRHGNDMPSLKYGFVLLCTKVGYDDESCSRYLRFYPHLGGHTLYTHSNHASSRG